MWKNFESYPGTAVARGFAALYSTSDASFGAAWDSVGFTCTHLLAYQRLTGSDHIFDPPAASLSASHFSELNPRSIIGIRPMITPLARTRTSLGISPFCSA